MFILINISYYYFPFKYTLQPSNIQYNQNSILSRTITQSIMGNENINPYQIPNIKNKGCCDKLSLYVSSESIDPSQITCSICFTIFTSPRIMKCKHIFCEECITTWGKGSTVSCPYCRIELKKYRGNFGRTDKKTQKKIESIFLKCRNCCWTGSHCQFLTEFQISPYLDDQVVPTLNEQEEAGQKLYILEGGQEKKQNLQLGRTAQKQQLKSELLDEYMQSKQNRKGFGLFINHLIQMRNKGSYEQSEVNKGFFYNPNEHV